MDDENQQADAMIDMRIFRGYLGGGIMVDDQGLVVVGIRTNGNSIDLTMTKVQAQDLSEKLAKAAK